MGMGFSLSKAPFEDPTLAEGIQDYAWEDLFEQLDQISRDFGFSSYEDVMRNAKQRAKIQETATKLEVKEMVRKYFDAGNGQISEMDAIQLIHHLAKARHYFQLTPAEESSNRQSMKGYFEREEATTAWEFLGNAKSSAIKSTIQDLKASCLVGDIRIAVYREEESPDEDYAEEEVGPAETETKRNFTKNLFLKLSGRKPAEG